MNWCNKCKHYHSMNHGCLKYEYNIPEYMSDDDWHEVYEFSMAEAAIKACKEFDDDGEYIIVSRGELELIRIRDENGNEQKFKITAEAIPTYDAEELE